MSEVTLVNVRQLKQIAPVLVPASLHNHGRQPHDVLERLQPGHHMPGQTALAHEAHQDGDRIEHLIEQERTFLHHRALVPVQGGLGQLQARQSGVDERARLHTVRKRVRQLLDALLEKLGQLLDQRGHLHVVAGPLHDLRVRVALELAR